MIATLLGLLAVAEAGAPAGAPAPKPNLVLVMGAPGAPPYASRFADSIARWQKAAVRAAAAVTTIGNDNDRTSDRTRLEATLRAAAAEPGPLWLVLIGHGTYDGRQARFNLRGPDVTAQELATWCKPLTRPLVVVVGASASGPFINALAAPQRIIVTATKSGSEQSAPRFPTFFAEAIADPRADLDHDGGVSVFEAFVQASKRVDSAYAEEGLLATEHPLLDDNGDGQGTAAAAFQSTTPTTATATRDGARARVTALVPLPSEIALPPPARQRRDDLEAKVAALRDARAKLGDAAYFRRLEPLLVQLAELYRAAGQFAAP
jgi:hypothetical protein